MCCCKVNPVLYRTERTYQTQSKHPFFMLPIIASRLASGHENICLPVGLCVYMCTAGSQCELWLQFTNRVCLSLPDTGAILASCSDAHHPSVRSPCGSLQAKVTGSHSSSILAFCLRVQVVWKCVRVVVCLCGVCAWVVCLLCHKLHSVRGEALQEGSALVTNRGAHTHKIWNLEL